MKKKNKLKINSKKSQRLMKFWVMTRKDKDMTWVDMKMDKGDLGEVDRISNLTWVTFSLVEGMEVNKEVSVSEEMELIQACLRCSLDLAQVIISISQPIREEVKAVNKDKEDFQIFSFEIINFSQIKTK